MVLLVPRVERFSARVSRVFTRGWRTKERRGTRCSVCNAVPGSEVHLLRPVLGRRLVWVPICRLSTRGPSLLSYYYSYFIILIMVKLFNYDIMT